MRFPYFALVAASVREHMAFPAAFGLKVLALVLSYSATLVTTWAALRAFGSLDGWKFSQVVMLYGLGVLCYGIASVLFWEMRNVGVLVRYGLLDTVLTKPASPLLFISARRVELTSIAHVLIGVVLLTWSWQQLALGFSVGMLFSVLLFIMSGSLIYAGFHVATGALAFWIIDARAAWSIQADVREMSWYPLSIYPSFVQVLLATVYPLAFVAFLPVGVLADVPHTGIFPANLAALAPVVAVVWFVGALALWRIGLNGYEGTGS